MPQQNSEEILSDAVLTGITEAMKQFAALLETSAQYAQSRSRSRSLSKTPNPGQELYWGGFVEGMLAAAEMAREVRPLRGVK